MDETQTRRERVHPRAIRVGDTIFDEDLLPDGFGLVLVRLVWPFRTAFRVLYVQPNYVELVSFSLHDRDTLDRATR